MFDEVFLNDLTQLAQIEAVVRRQVFVTISEMILTKLRGHVPIASPDSSVRRSHPIRCSISGCDLESASADSSVRSGRPNQHMMRPLREPNHKPVCSQCAKVLFGDEPCTDHTHACRRRESSESAQIHAGPNKKSRCRIALTSRGCLAPSNAPARMGEPNRNLFNQVT